MANRYYLIDLSSGQDRLGYLSSVLGPEPNLREEGRDLFHWSVAADMRSALVELNLTDEEDDWLCSQTWVVPLGESHGPVDVPANVEEYVQDTSDSWSSANKVIEPLEELEPG